MKEKGRRSQRGSIGQRGKKARKGGNRTATGRESPSGGAELLPHQATFNWLVREEQVDAIMDGMTSPDLMERVDSQLRV